MENGSSVLTNERQTNSKPLPWDAENPIVLVPLHQYPEFTFPCATLINMEWPRSRESRLNSLWSCSQRFPVAMVLIKCDDRQVIGHCKLSLIPGHPEACFVESVVIHPDMRGKGLGTILMTKLEDYVCSRKLSTVYLSTMGQEKFYSKLGYEECEPVSLYAFSMNIKSSNDSELGNSVKKPSDCSNNGELENAVKKPADSFEFGELRDSLKEQTDPLKSSKQNKSSTMANDVSPKNQLSNSAQKSTDISNKSQTINGARKPNDASSIKGKIISAGKKAQKKAKSNRNGNECNGNTSKTTKNNQKNLDVLLLGCVTLSPPPPPPPPPPPKLLGENVMVKKTYMKKKLQIRNNKEVEKKSETICETNGAAVRLKLM